MHCRSEREIGHQLRNSGDVDLAMQLAWLMVSVCCVLSILSWPTKRFLCCHCLSPLGDNVRNLQIVQVRDPLKKTVASVSQMLAVKSASAAVPIGRCWRCLLAGANVCHNKFLYSFIYTVHTPSMPSHTPSKLTDFDGISYSLYSPQKIIS